MVLYIYTCLIECVWVVFCNVQAGETGMSALRRFSRAGINIAATTMVTSAIKVRVIVNFGDTVIILQSQYYYCLGVALVHVHTCNRYSWLVF